MNPKIQLYDEIEEFFLNERGNILILAKTDDILYKIFTELQDRLPSFRCRTTPNYIISKLHHKSSIIGIVLSSHSLKGQSPHFLIVQRNLINDESFRPLIYCLKNEYKDTIYKEFDDI